MSKGFKETEIGLIPSEWKVSDLSEICDLKKKTCIPSEAHTDIYVGLEHIGTGQFILNRHGNPDEVRSAKNCFIENDILYGKLRPYLDKAVMTNCTGICSTDILVFTPKNQTPSLYIAATIHTKQFLTHAIKTTHGVNHPRTSWVAIKAFRFPLPPLPEQKKIAAVLSKLQKAIEIQDKILGSLRDLKKSMMHRLFSYGLKGEKRKKTEIGLMPEGWAVTTLIKQCQKPEYGFTESAQRDNVGPKFLRITDITEKGVDWEHVPYCICPKEKLDKFRLINNDILFARIGATTGKSFIVKNPPIAIYASYLIRVRPLKMIAPDFLYYYFSTEKYWKQIDAQKGNCLKGGVNGSILSELIIPLPPVPEQTEIAHILQTIDHKIEIHKGKKSSYQNLFKTMLNKLMTGTIRVNELDIDTAEVEAA